MSKIDQTHSNHETHEMKDLKYLTAFSFQLQRLLACIIKVYFPF